MVIPWQLCMSLFSHPVNPSIAWLVCYPWKHFQLKSLSRFAITKKDVRVDTYMEHDQNAICLVVPIWNMTRVLNKSIDHTTKCKQTFIDLPCFPCSPLQKFRLWKLTNTSFKPLYWLWRNSKAWSCRNYKRYLCGWCIKPTEGKANGSIPGCIRIR